MDAPVRIMIDSGAFSAWKLRKAIDFNQYCAWLKQNEEWVDAYVCLDEIIPSNPEEAATRSFSNLIAMRKLGLNPIPVFHVGESIDWLKRILDLGCDYIGLSASSIESMGATDDWYELAWSHIVDSTGAPLVKVHAFGEGREPCMKKFPWYSVDSASWLSSQQHGRLMMPDYFLGHTKSFTSSRAMPDIAMLGGFDQEVLQADLKKFNVRPDVFDERNGRVVTVARAYLAGCRWAMIERRVRESMPIRFMSNRGGLFSNPPSNAPLLQPLEDEFYFYFGVGNSALTVPCLEVAGGRNLLVSYFYISPKEGGQLIKSYKSLRLPILHSPPYKQYLDILIRDVLIDSSALELT